MTRLICALALVLTSTAALAQRAAPAPAVEDPAVAQAMTAAARALLESVRGTPEFSERLSSYARGLNKSRFCADTLIGLNNPAIVGRCPVTALSSRLRYMPVHERARELRRPKRR